MFFKQPQISAIHLGTSQSKGLHKVADVTCEVVLLVNIHVCNINLPSLGCYAIVLSKIVHFTSVREDIRCTQMTWLAGTYLSRNVNIMSLSHFSLAIQF